MFGSNSVTDALDRFTYASIIDIISIAIVIYLALLLLKGTTAMSLLARHHHRHHRRRHSHRGP